jgi:hypothetical protein
MLHRVALVRTDVFLHSVRRLLVAACVVPSSQILVTLMKEAIGSSETSVLTRTTRHNIPEDTIHQGQYYLFMSFIVASLFSHRMQCSNEVCYQVDEAPQLQAFMVIKDIQSESLGGSSINKQ